MKYKVIAKKLTALGLALVMAAGLFACGAQEKGIELRVCLAEQKVESLDPAYFTTTGEQIVIDQLYENLMKAGNDGSGGVTAMAGQAKSYERTANANGTVTYRFTLRDDLTWSDGQRVTALDFAYAWGRLVNINTASPHAAILNMVAGYDQARSADDLSYLQISAESESVFTVTLTYDSPYFLTSVCTSPYTMPLRQDVIESGAEMPVSNGVFTLAERSDTTLTLTEKADYYDDKRSGPSKIEFTLTDNTADAWELYRSNQADFVLGLPDEELASLAKDEYWQADSAASTYMILFNQLSISVSSADLRRAIALTVDYEALGNIVNADVHPAATGLVPFGITNYFDGSDFRAAGDTVDTNREDYVKNCETAARLVRGIDMSSLGEIRYTYEKTDVNQAVAELLQRTWKEKLNLTVTLYPVTAEELQAQLSKGEFILAGVSMTADRNDATAFLDHWVNGDEGNYTHFTDSAYDLLIDVSRVSASAEARSAYLEDAEALLLEKNVVLPLYFSTRAWEMRADLTGLFRDSLGNYYFTAIRKATA